MQPMGLGGGAIAGITISALLVVLLLCVVLTIVCLVLIFARKSKRKKTRQKTFGKARFIRSVYILPTLYNRAAKTDTAKKGSTEQNLASTTDEREREEEQQAMEQEVKTELEREISNSDMYVNQQELASSTDPLTPSEEVNDDENFYENNPLARRYFRAKEKEEEKGREQENEQDQESTRDYVNKAMFTQPPNLNTELPSNGVEPNDDELYVNNLLARKKLQGLPLYDSEKSDISTTTNRAYGVTKRSDNLINLMQQQQPNQQQQQSETNGENEYVYVDVNKDSPEEEYEDMAAFQAQKFAKKQRR